MFLFSCLVLLIYFSHDPAISFPSSSTIFQGFPGISDLLSEVFKFQRHTKLCSKCSTLLVSSLILSPVCCHKEPSSSWMLFLPWQSWINFTCTSCIVYYNATQIVEIFRILQLCLISYDLYRDGCLEIFIAFVFPHSFPFHRVFEFQPIIHPMQHTFLSLPVAQVHLHISQCELLVLLCWSLQTQILPDFQYSSLLLYIL